MIPFQSIIVNRVVNYAVVPFLAKSSQTLESWWSHLNPESRRRIYTGIFCIFWPIYSIIDGMRFALVRLYVSDSKAAAAVWHHSRALNAIVFHGTTPKVANWSGPTSTRMYGFPLVLLCTPFFYVADITRSVATDKLKPECSQEAQDLCEAIWANTFASMC